jgi:hypothetical protein
MFFKLITILKKNHWKFFWSDAIVLLFISLLNIQLYVGIKVRVKASQRYFSYIVAVSFIGGGNRKKTTGLPKVTDKFYQNIISSTPRHERDSNSQCWRWKALIAYVVVNPATIRSRRRRAPINMNKLIYPKNVYHEFMSVRKLLKIEKEWSKYCFDQLSLLYAL